MLNATIIPLINQKYYSVYVAFKPNIKCNFSYRKYEKQKTRKLCITKQKRKPIFITIFLYIYTKIIYNFIKTKTPK